MEQPSTPLTESNPHELQKEPICIVGESGEPIHYLMMEESTMYCDEALTLTCSALSDVFPDLLPSTMAFYRDGKIIPFTSLIAAGSTIQLGGGRCTSPTTPLAGRPLGGSGLLFYPPLTATGTFFHLTVKLIY